MAYVKYTATNLASGTLLAGIAAGATSLILSTGQGDLFPTTFPFKVKLEQFDTNVPPRVIKREIVKCTNRVGDTLTIVRSHEACPSAYNSTTQTTTAYAFLALDTVNVIETADSIDDVQDEVTRLETAKLDLAGGTMTGVLKEAIGADIVSATTTNLATATGNSLTVTGTTTITGFGTVTAGTIFRLTFSGILTLTHNGTSLILPTSANITTVSGDVAILESLGSGNWKCLTYQRSDGTALASTGYDSVFWTGTDGAIWAGALTLTGSNNTVIVKNYTTFAPGANTVTITPTGCVTIIKCTGAVDLTGTTFSFNGKGMAGGTPGGAGWVNGAGSTGTASVASTLLIKQTAPLWGAGWASTPTSGGGWTGGSSIFTQWDVANGTLGSFPFYLASLDATATDISDFAFVPQWGSSGGGGGGFSSGSTGWVGGVGGASGGVLIIIAKWTVTISGTTVNMNGVAGSNGWNGSTGGGWPYGGGGGGGGGAGGIFALLALWTITGSVTPTVAGGAGGTGWAGSSGPLTGLTGGAGGAGKYIIRQII